MADKAHKQTDKKLAEMESELSDIYEKAGKEIEEKAKAYFERYAEQEKEKLKLVEQGKMTEEEYQAWLRKKVATGNNWTRKKQELAAQYEHVNEIALAYINGRMPDIYALNYNYSAQRITDAVKSAISYDLVTPEIVKALADKHRTFLPHKTVNHRKYQRWCTHKINSAVLQGVLQGDSVNTMAKRLESVTRMDRDAALRNARTMVTSAENKARMDTAEKASEKGVITKKVWLYTHDLNVRDGHKQAGMDYGKSNPIDTKEPFMVYHMVGNSKIGYTRVSEPLMYPCDPNGSPDNVYNCRCSCEIVHAGFTSILPPEKRGKIKVTFT